MKKFSNQRPTIGILVNSLNNEFTIKIWDLIKKKAQSKDLNTICFSGAEINHPNQMWSARSFVFNLIDKQNVDSLLIITSSLCHFISPEELEVFFNKFNFPKISFGVQIKNIPSIITNNSFGFRTIIDHLFENHQCKKPFYLSGPKNSPESIERLSAFNDSCKKYGIVVKDEGIVNAQYRSGIAYEVVKKLINDRTFNYDSIIAANDFMAMGAIHALEENNYSIPYDIAVIGFDDVARSKSLLSPLTTVKQPIEEMINKAFDNLIKLMQGYTIPIVEIIDSIPVIRNSCGCISNDINLIFSNNKLDTFKNIELNKNDIEKVIKDDILLLFSDYSNIERNNMYFILEKFIMLINNEIISDIFLQKFNETILKSVKSDFDEKLWFEFIFLIRKRFLFLYSKDPEIIIQIENIIHQMQILVTRTLKQFEMKKLDININQNIIYRSIIYEIVSVFNLETLLDVLAIELIKLGILRCYLSLFESNDKIFERANLILGYDENGKTPLNKDGYNFLSVELIPAEIINISERYDLVLISLVNHPEKIGFIIFESTTKESLDTTAIIDIVEASIKSSLLMKETIEKGRNLEIAINEIKLNQEKLLVSEKMASIGRFTAGITHEMSSPLAIVKTNLLQMTNLINSSDSSINTESKNENEEIFKMLDSFIQNSNKSLDKVTDFIKSIKLQTSKNIIKNKDYFNLKEAVRVSIVLNSFSMRNKNIHFEFVCKTDNIEIYGRSNRITQAISALILNSIDSITDKNNGKIKLTIIEEENNAVIINEDNGRGIPKTNMTKLFDPFFTTKPFGLSSGLGLSIVHEIIYQEFNGKIEIISEVDMGTIIKLLIPRATHK